MFRLISVGVGAVIRATGQAMKLTAGGCSLSAPGERQHARPSLWLDRNGLD